MPIDFIEEAPGIDFKPLPDSGSGIDFQEDEAPGALGGAWNSLRRGINAAQAVLPTALLPGAARTQPTIRQERKAHVQAMKDPGYLSNLSLAGDDATAQAKAEARFGPGQKLEQLTAPQKAIRDVWAGVVADFAKERETIPKSAAQEAMAEASGSDGKWRVFRQYPVQTVTSIVLESLPASVAGAVVGTVAGGPGVGTAGGVGLASASQEFAGEFLNSASKAGYDPTDAGQLAQFLDSAAFDEAMKRATARASIVGGVDAATAGAAGQFIGPALKQGLKRVLSATGKEAGLQAAGGAGGELLAQTATKEPGQGFDWFDIAMEGVAEIASGPVEAVSNLRQASQQTSKIDFRPTEEAGQPAGGPAVQLPAAPPADTSRAALTELQTMLRGEAPGSARLKRPDAVKPPEPAAAPVPDTTVAPRAAAATEEMRAALEFQRQKDAAVQKYVAQPDKDFSGMSRLELELLDGMGDARAMAELRRRRSQPAGEKPAGEQVGQGEREQKERIVAAAFLREYGVTQPNTVALLNGTKTVEQVIDEQFSGITARTPAGVKSHDEAVQAAREDATVTLHGILNNLNVQRSRSQPAGEKPAGEKVGQGERETGQAIDFDTTDRVAVRYDNGEIFSDESALHAIVDSNAQKTFKQRKAADPSYKPPQLQERGWLTKSGKFVLPDTTDLPRNWKSAVGGQKPTSQQLEEIDQLSSTLASLDARIAELQHGLAIDFVPESAPPAPAETITGPAGDLTIQPADEQTGSAMPAEAPHNVPPALATPQPSRRRGSIRIPDLLDEIEGQSGKINPKLIREADPNWRPHPNARRLFSSRGRPADVVLNSLTYDGPKFGLQQDTAMDAFGHAINDAASGRRGAREQAQREKRLLDAEAREAMAAGEKGEAAKDFAAKHQQELPGRKRGGFVPARFEIKKPIIGQTGAKIVGYEWRSMMGEKWSEREGGYIEARVSDWDNVGESKGTGREIVHLYYVEHSDGRVTTEGIRSAQNVLGLSETRLQTIAKHARAEQDYRQQQEVAEAKSMEDRAVNSQAEANRQYRTTSHSPMRTFEENQKVFSEARLYEKAGKFVRTIKPTEWMAKHGWNPFETASDPIESALDKLKIDIDPSQLHAFGLLPEIWNGLVEVVRLAYRGGKTIAAAIDDGLRWLRATHPDATFQEGEIRQHFNQELDAARLEPERLPHVASRAREIREELRAIRERGEAPSQALIDEQSEMEGNIEEAMNPARPNRGRIPKVDENLEEAGGKGGKGEREKGRRIPQWRGEERLPHGRLRDLFTGLRRWRSRTGNWLARRGSTMDVTIGREAADNRGMQAANHASLSVRLVLNRAFDTAPRQVRVKHELREAALTFVVEADGDRTKLGDFWETVANSEHAESKAGRQATLAIEYAEQHWDKLQSAAALYKELTETEREAELNEGVNSHEWEGGYVYHRWTKDAPGTGADPTKPTPAGTPFRKPRSVATYAEGIADGRAPTTLNALELLADRVASGQRRMNELSWVHGLRNLMDPVTDEPVVVDVIRKARRPVALPKPASRAEPTAEEMAGPAFKPEWVSSAPPGYTVWRMGDLEVAVQEGFTGLLNKLTAASYFKGATSKKVFGFQKSVLLLFDTFHLGRLAAWLTMITGNPAGYRKGQTLLDFSTADIREMAQRGEIPANWADGLVENKRRLDLAISTGFNVGNVLDNAWGDALHNLPGIGRFNKWLFGQYQRGAMSEAWLISFERERKQRPKETEAQVARRVSRVLNARFGNLGRQGLFKSRTAQDWMRFCFLAPQWNESLIRSELGALGDATIKPIESILNKRWEGGIPDSIRNRRIVVGTLLRATGLMAVGTFLANQILNYAFRGKPTWENEEEGWDKKISAWLPDVISGGPGIFLNPIALPLEYTHLIEGNLHRSGGDFTEAFLRIFNSRLHPISRAVTIFISRRGVLGRKLREGEILPAMGKAMIPAPIASGTVASAAKQIVTGEPSEQFPGQYQKQLLSSFGMKTDQAPNAEQRIRNLAREFNREKGIVPSAEFFTGDFDGLNKALRIGNTRDARDELDDLLKKKTPRQVYDHYKRVAATPFTGQRARESEFWRGLTAEQRARYMEAREARRRTALKAGELLRERVSAAE